MKILGAVLFITVPILAQQKQSPSATALRAAHVLDARSGTLVSPGLFVVQGERIVSVGGTRQRARR